MKTFFIILTTLLILANSAQAAIYCNSLKKNNPISLRIDTVGRSQNGFAQADVVLFGNGTTPRRLSGIPHEVKVDGCEKVLFAGMKNGMLNSNYAGDLYIECDGDGDAGVIELQKRGEKSYTGVFRAPNGKTSLGLDDEENLPLSCFAK